MKTQTKRMPPWKGTTRRHKIIGSLAILAAVLLVVGLVLVFMEPKRMDERHELTRTSATGSILIALAGCFSVLALLLEVTGYGPSGKGPHLPGIENHRVHTVHEYIDILYIMM